MEEQKFFMISEELLSKIGTLTVDDAVVIKVAAKNMIGDISSNSPLIMSIDKLFWKEGNIHTYNVIVCTNYPEYTTLTLEHKEQQEIE